MFVEGVERGRANALIKRKRPTTDMNDQIKNLGGNSLHQSCLLALGYFKNMQIYI